jgi:hypothetical protein
MKSLLILILFLAAGCNRPSVDPTLRANADAGNLDAQLTVGNLYLDEKDNELGRKYMLMAAEQGSIDGINNLGYIETGVTGAPENKREALKWHRIAEILSKQESSKVKFDKRDMESSDIQYAESQARKWLADRPTITSK